ncbi:MAG TPA: hypothetical protein VKA62_09110 [Agromyces sp.]|nr:hypothetical protein [Agromyces sp.]
MSRRTRRIRPPVEDPPAEAERPADARVAGYRLLRRVASGDRADVYLATAADRARQDDEGDGGAALVALRIYDRAKWNESIALEIEAMSADASGTLPALYDVAGLDDGRCCLAVERIAGVPASRILAERSLAPGEAVTMLAPIVAAAAELARLGFVHTRLSSSDILIDDAGRPRLIGLGALDRLPPLHEGAARTALLRRGHEALAFLITDVAGATRPAGALDTVTGLLHARLEARPFTTCEEEVERALFAAASPEPIGGIALRARPAAVPARMTIPVAPEHSVLETSESGEAYSGNRRSGGIRSLLALAQLPGPEEFADATAAGPARTLLARVRGAASARRRPLVFGGFIGGSALVMLLTLVPPATAGVGAGSDRAGSTTKDVNTPTTAPKAAGDDTVPDDADAQVESAVPEILGDASADVASVAAGLLELRESCFAALDLACLDQVVQPGSAIEAEDRAALIAARDGADHPVGGYDLDQLVVSADMGAAVLVTVPFADGERQPASLLLMRGEAGWRLRELFD